MKSHLRIRISRRMLHLSLTLAAILLIAMQSQAPAAHATAAVAAPVAPVAPVAVDAALVNAASFDPSRIVAPGSIGALFSSGMTDQAPASATTLPLPTSLAGISVKIDGISAPLFFASAAQVNLQVPSGVDLGSATIEVFRTGVASPVATGTCTIAEASPGVFTVDYSGAHQAAVLNSDLSYNSDFDKLPGSRPEASGSVVVIYATGQGRTTPLVPDGQPAPFGPLAVADGVTAVTIGGLPANVSYSGLAPGFVGLWQINVSLPASLPTNLSTPFSVSLKGRSSNPGATTTIAVANKNEFGSASGKVVSALTGTGIGGANVTLQPNGGGTLRQAQTNGSGEYNVYVISPGNYNLQAAAAGFIPASQSSTISGGGSLVLPPIALSQPLAANQFRVVVTWLQGYDLDAHLTGPGTNGGRYHVWWNGETGANAQLDRDDQSGTGPETLTFSPGAGSFKFSVQDYKNRDLNGSMGFAGARPVVRVFQGSQQVAVISPPGGGGTFWKVFEIQNQQFSVVNQLGDEPDPSNIKVSY